MKVNNTRFSRQFLSAPILVVSTLVLAGAMPNSSFAAERPNVVLVLADDLGIGDISPTNPNCKIQTPSLQKMADEGMTFLDAHTSSSVCTPTRYGLLTGRYNWRSRLSRGVLNGTSSLTGAISFVRKCQRRRGKGYSA